MPSADEQDRYSDIGQSWYGPFGARPGVERTDDDIEADLVTALQNDPSIDPSAVGVSVDNGLVTLTGVVDSAEAGKSAENDAWNTPGVVDVRNNLETVGPGT